MSLLSCGLSTGLAVNFSQSFHSALPCLTVLVGHSTGSAVPLDTDAASPLGKAQFVYQSCPSGQVSAAQCCAVLTQGSKPVQVQELQSCTNKRFQQGCETGQSPSWLLHWSCVLLPVQSLPAPACITGRSTHSLQVACPCISFSSALNTKRVPFTTITSYLHICIFFCNTEEKILRFPS